MKQIETITVQMIFLFLQSYLLCITKANYLVQCLGDKSARKIVGKYIFSSVAQENTKLTTWLRFTMLQKYFNALAVLEKKLWPLYCMIYTFLHIFLVLYFQFASFFTSSDDNCKTRYDKKT